MALVVEAMQAAEVLRPMPMHMLMHGTNTTMVAATFLR